MKTALIALAAIALVAAGAFAITRDPNKSNTNPPAPSNTTTRPPASNPASGTQTAGSTITYSDSGFSPATVTVKSGAAITIKNTSSHEVDFASDSHPVHMDDPELNAGTITPGQTVSITVTTKGAHGYHNHLNPAETGTVVVQ